MDMDELPTLVCREGIEHTEDGRVLVDGQPVTSGACRLDLGGGIGSVLTVI